VLVGGMATSTLLSLLYVPVAYTYFDSFSKLGGRLIHWRPTFWRRQPQGHHEEPLPVAGGSLSRAGERLRSLRGRRRRNGERAVLSGR
jgi:hypothetical protein